MKYSLLICGVLSLFQTVNSQAQEKPKYNKNYNNWYYDSREKLYQGINEKHVDIVFFGNSITERGPWNELFGMKYTIGNRGIGGDNTFGMKARIADVLKSKPKKIFLMMGINDIGRGLPTEMTLANYEEIIEIIQKNSPKTKIYLQSTLPVNQDIITIEYHKDKKKVQMVKDLNAGIVQLAQKYKVTYVDLKEVLADNYVLKPEYTADGIHLVPAAYLVWAQYLKDKKYL